MKSLRVFPRLPLSLAAQRAESVRTAFDDAGVVGVRALVGFSHAGAAPVATGGRAATVREIEQVRAEVIDELAGWLPDGPRGPKGTMRFDVTLGQALHEALRIVPADAAHDETWSFLSLMVFPDVVTCRFPDLHDDRLLGRPRNALRRVWQRTDALGDLLYTHPNPLGEDEAVGLFERTAMARNRRLLRLAAVEVMDRSHPNRSQWARELYKRITYVSGPVLLDFLTDRELRGIVREAAHQADTVCY